MILKERTVIRIKNDTERAIPNNNNKEFIFIVVQVKQDSIDKGATSDDYAIEEKPNW